MSDPNNQSTLQNPVGRFMVAVGAVLENTLDETILIIKRAPTLDWRASHWEIGYGRIDQFESPEQGLARETFEELGVTYFSIRRVLTVWHLFRGSQKAENELVGITYYCTTNTKSIKLSDEHTDYAWVTPEEAVKKITEPGIIRDVTAYVAYKQSITQQGLQSALGSD